MNKDFNKRMWTFTLVSGALIGTFTLVLTSSVTFGLIMGIFMPAGMYLSTYLLNGNWSGEFETTNNNKGEGQ